MVGPSGQAYHDLTGRRTLLQRRNKRHGLFRHARWVLKVLYRTHRRNAYIAPVSQRGPIPQRLSLRRSDSDLLTCFHEDTSSVRDGYSMIAISLLIRCRFLAGKSTHKAEYRGAAETKTPSSQNEYSFDHSEPQRKREQTRLGMYSWNPAPRRGSPGAIEDLIAGKWNIIALQEAIGYLQHGRLTSHFFVIHFAVCAIMFNKDTFHSDIQVGSVYVHDVRKSPSNHEGQAGWVLEAVISRSIPIEESRLKGNLISP